MKLKNRTSINIGLAVGYSILGTLFFFAGMIFLISTPTYIEKDNSDFMLKSKTCMTVANQFGFKTNLNKTDSKLIIYASNQDISQEQLANISTTYLACQGLSLFYFCAGKSCANYPLSLHLN